MQRWDNHKASQESQRREKKSEVERAGAKKRKRGWNGGDNAGKAPSRL
jgi:hypothetical protein